MYERYIVEARFRGEQLDIREFITPSNSLVLDLVDSVRGLPGGSLENAWNAAVCSLSYPKQEPVDYHYREAFVAARGGPRIFDLVQKPLFVDTAYEFFQLPFETLALGVGNCDDQAIAAVSVLRNFAGDDQIFCTLGRWNGYGHAWVTLRHNGTPLILETTHANHACRAAFRGLAEGKIYVPWVHFNDVCVEIVEPGIVEGEYPRYFIKIDKIGLTRREMEKFALLRVGHLTNA